MLKETKLEREREKNNMSDLPEGYRLLPGELYDTSLQFSPEEAKQAADYICGKDEPIETRQFGCPDYTISESLWYDLTNNVVKRYQGQNTQDKPIWEEAPEATKFVIDERNGCEIVGKILRSACAPFPKKEKIEIPPLSYKDILSDLI